MRRFYNVSGGLLGLLLSWASPATAAETTPAFPVPFNTQTGEYHLTPAGEALAKIKAPSGFNVALVAAEPDIQNPISISTDDRGRLWIAENYTYAETSFEMRLRDRIVVLEDTHQDGHFDKRTVFWDAGQKLTSVEPGFGGVYALCAPRLLFIPDRDGDLVPDGEPEVLLDGWEENQVHHNIVNGLRWGPDGWLYGRHGIQGTSHVGKPGAAPAERQALNCSIWRYHPTRRIFEVVCQGTTNPWGMDWNDVGEAFFINTVIGHLFHVIPGAHYKRMYGEDFDAHIYEPIDQHADHYHWDTGSTWQKSKGLEGRAGDLGGGHAHSGLMIYLGDNWPDRYRDTLFTINFHGLRLNNDLLTRAGSGYVGRHTNDFLSFNDQWFRGIELVYGPDGAVYVADWSDVGECHEHDGVHRTSGRIYKVTYGTREQSSFGDLNKLSDTELVQLQLHKNDWFVRKARRILQERSASGHDLRTAYSELLKLFNEQTSPTRKLRAMWALATSGGATQTWLMAQLKHPNEHLRVWAVRFLTEQKKSSPETIKSFVQMAKEDNSALVRLALASALQRIAIPQRGELAKALVQHADDADDHNLPLMIWYGIEPLAKLEPETLTDLANQTRIPLLRKFIARRLTEDIESQPAFPNRLLESVTRRDSHAQLDVLEGMSMALHGWRKAPKPSSWDSVSKILFNSPEKRAREITTELAAVFGDGRALEELRRVALDEHAEPGARRSALQSLIASKAPDLLPMILKLLSDRIMARSAVQGLGIFDDPHLAGEVLTRYNDFRSDVQPDVISVLASRASHARVLLEFVAAGKLDRRNISAYHARQIHSFGDAELDRLLGQHWGELRNTPEEKKRQMDALRMKLKPETLKTADLKKGHEAFLKTCAACHRLYGEGGTIGPDLTGSGRKDLGYLVENIVEPSAVVPADYKMSFVELKDGRVLTGLVGEKRERTVGVQTLTEKLVIDRNDIQGIQPSALSLMPEGLLQGLSDQETRDLFAYLMTSSQP